jgi:hypothetical protein
MIKANEFVKILALFLLAPNLFTSCSDFFETNIEDMEITVYAPADGFVSQTQSVNFWWELLDGATHYQLQIVTPSFEEVWRVAADTIMTENQLLLVLNPGTYQWRIRGFNSAYSTAYATYSFTVLQNMDLNLQEIVLKSPVDSLYTNELNILFEWYALVAAEKYFFEIRTTSGSPVINPFETSDDHAHIPNDIEIESLANGFYRWGVYAVNWFSSTQPSYRVFALDTESPGQPILISPAVNDTISTGNIPFSWMRTNQTISPQFDSLYIFNREDVLIEKHSVYGTSKLVNLQKGRYKWKVRTFSKAGNIGDFSITNSFLVMDPVTDFKNQHVAFNNPMDCLFTRNQSINISLDMDYNAQSNSTN